MEPKIVKKETDKEFYVDERCFIINSSGPGDKIMSIIVVKVEPGVVTASHYLEGIDERYLIISGKGRMELGELPPEEVESGDVVYIPAGTKQRIANIGGEDLQFYCICTPPFDESCYHSAE